ncbi:GH3 auxin-responsive promoter family protein [Dyadobacter sp. CY356]|uniref:GH3 family domain-containing protein n=1 Tax=Dyadobacter sp. CY356 TaxID=2906442 RepID=UPI001F2F39FE|nr:GH3 auxin-responsive promoter family protein [Dyadobacter sp. CY356]MCF0056586.1 GH3 auxin-responsive promoter family protein [Dyadobacter sp. CY356]
MAVIGELIKKAIDLTGYIKSEPDPVKEQREILQMLLEKARLTAFGKAYKFKEILESDNIVAAFQQLVPVHDYDKMNADWWHYLLEGHQNVTWPGGQKYFALSSGTTSNSKHIPVTDDMLDAIKKSGTHEIMNLSAFNLPAEFFEKQILMLGSSTNLIEKDDHLEGEISGISASNIPGWFSGYYKPGREIADIKDWDERVKAIAEQAPDWDIGCLSGIPAWIELMLKEIIKKHNLKNIHEIWPNLQVYTTGGVAFEPYRKSLEKLFAHPLIYIDTYLASEGFIAIQNRPETSSMALLTNSGIFFEFVPMEGDNIDDDGLVKPNAEIVALEDAAEDVNYCLLISTVSGAWRYMIGDTVMLTDKARAEIKITGRTKHYLNVVGEQLSVNQMNGALRVLEKEYDLVMTEFIAAAIHKNEEFILKWYISSDKFPDFNKVAESLDNALQISNKNYKVARGKALKGIEVVLISDTLFHKWSEETKKLGGQVKIPRVMKEEDFLEFEAYINQHL